MFCFVLSNSLQDQKNDDKSIFSELNQVAAVGDDDDMDADMPLDINCNNQTDAHREKKRHLKKVLHEIKETVVQAIDIMDADDSDGANADDDKEALNKQ